MRKLLVQREVIDVAEMLDLKGGQKLVPFSRSTLLYWEGIAKVFPKPIARLRNMAFYRIDDVKAGLMAIAKSPRINREITPEDIDTAIAVVMEKNKEINRELLEMAKVVKEIEEDGEHS